MAIKDNVIICGDCLEVLPKLPRAKMIFADPPDNLGLKYEGFKDEWDDIYDYLDWLLWVTKTTLKRCDVFWLSYNRIWDYELKGGLFAWEREGLLPKEVFDDIRTFIWRFTFGQHNKYDCGNGYRPILRIKHPSAILYPDAIRVPSARQTLYNDKRANPKGRVPDDVWEFSRVCGTFKEKRRWHPNQHPEALLERIIKLSCKPGDLMIDMFAGTGTSNRVCKRLGVHCIGIEISRFYCEKIAEENQIEMVEAKDVEHLFAGANK